MSSPQTACWASSANSATCHGWTPTTLDTQPVEPQADGDVADRGVEVDRVGLEAVEPLRLQQPEEAGLLELLDRGLGDDAQPLGLVGPLPERGQQVTDAVEDSLDMDSPVVDRVMEPILEHVLVLVEQTGVVPDGSDG